ncbi:ComF family protein [Clostridium sp. MSJ-11]|uniref:ComF family protein n=1 Tax=Clostridium mobile TaxID=2841512 RepID=A0ABS6EMW3_9CLOT|nr:ComF family protein [Clostridium mobile]MBU5486097.1 ComF family protein [Clostridium mobile]
MGNGIIKYLKNIVDAVLSIIYSERDECPLCKAYMEESFLCQRCLNKINFITGSFSIKREDYSFKCYSLANYSDNIAHMIIRLKYKKDFQCGEVLGHLLSKKIIESGIHAHYLTFVPMTKKAIKKRGYNQSEYLAKVVGKYLDIPVIKSLSKTKDTLDQIGLNSSERWNNVHDSFYIYNKNKINNKKIILIDDVITTGATAYNCAKELMNNGAKEINILTVAKSNV